MFVRRLYAEPVYRYERLRFSKSLTLMGTDRREQLF